MYIVVVLLVITLALFLVSVFVPPFTGVGKCGQAGSGPWKRNTACLSTDGGDTFLMHGPWESSMLVSAPKMGGCGNVKYDCQSTDAYSLFAYYSWYEKPGTKPPESKPEFVRYTKCCIMAQCRLPSAADNGGSPPNVQDCGSPPNVENDMPPGLHIVGLAAVPAGDLSGGQPSGLPGGLERNFATAACLTAVAAVGVAGAVIRVRRASQSPEIQEAEEEIDDEEAQALHPEIVE